MSLSISLRAHRRPLPIRKKVVVLEGNMGKKKKQDKRVVVMRTVLTKKKRPSSRKMMRTRKTIAASFSLTCTALKSVDLA